VTVAAAPDREGLWVESEERAKDGRKIEHTNRPF
jgi:hypothetical protein